MVNAATYLHKYRFAVALGAPREFFGIYPPPHSVNQSVTNRSLFLSALRVGRALSGAAVSLCSFIVTRTARDETRIHDNEKYTLDAESRSLDSAKFASRCNEICIPPEILRWCDGDFATPLREGTTKQPGTAHVIATARYEAGSNRVVTKIEIHYLCAMKYEIVQVYKAKAFRTVTGVTPETFSVMLDEVKPAYTKAHRRRGRHRKLSLERHAPHDA